MSGTAGPQQPVHKHSTKSEGIGTHVGVCVWCAGTGTHVFHMVGDKLVNWLLPPDSGQLKLTYTSDLLAL